MFKQYCLNHHSCFFNWGFMKQLIWIIKKKSINRRNSAELKINNEESSENTDEEVNIMLKKEKKNPKGKLELNYLIKEGEEVTEKVNLKKKI